MLLKDLPREALMRPLSRNEVVGMLFRLTVFGAATYYSIKWVLDAMDPTSKQKNQAKKRVCHASAHIINTQSVKYRKLKVGAVIEQCSRNAAKVRRFSWLTMQQALSVLVHSKHDVKML